MTSHLWSRRSSLVEVESETRVVLLDLDDLAHPPRILAGPAAAVWVAADGSRDTEAVCAEVARYFEISAQDIRTDVETFLSDLVAEGLLVGGPA
ncbi:PqqD family protein [Nocardioides gilvus]|uniref:PqqD family protein n=1 Tax=Nocardioides gilvus TaxID=1735589 RepID=UPI000D74D795|nr:PqqD family protein [Nocardioides gilvus]